MTAPRQILPGSYYFITRRTTQRQFLLTPDAMTNQILAYCLGLAAERTDMGLIAWQFMSNHYHAVVYDKHGNLPAFIECFHKIVAKTLNRRRDRWENLWSTEETCVARLIEFADVTNKAVYTLANPVAAKIVARVKDWDGLASLSYMGAPPRTIKRPNAFFADGTELPAEVKLGAVRPPTLQGTYTEWIAGVRNELRKREVAHARERGGKSLPKIIRSWEHVPGNKVEHRKLRPHIACLNKRNRDLAIRALIHFRQEHRRIRRQIEKGRRHEPMPLGTVRKLVWATPPLRV